MTAKIKILTSFMNFLGLGNFLNKSQIKIYIESHKKYSFPQSTKQRSKENISHHITNCILLQKFYKI